VDSLGDVGSGQVEWLDMGPPDAPAGPGSPRRSRRPWYLLAAAAAIVAILVAALNRDTKHHPAASTHPPTTGTSSTEPVPSEVSSSSAPPAIDVTNTGAKLLDVPADWELFARGPETLIRIELARGRITRTIVPALDTSGPGFSFVLGRNRAMVQSLDSGLGYVVPDGHPARDLPTAFGQQSPILPGPDPDHFWVQTGSDRQRVMALVGLDGRRTGPTIGVPNALDQAESDRAGYVRFFATGGTYDARPDGIKRITGGDLLAAGPTRWLAHECDEHYHCAIIVIDRATGARRTLVTSFSYEQFGGYSAGEIAPDGSTAAVARVDDQGHPHLSLLDLATGQVRATKVVLNSEQAYSGGVLVWAPDSRWLFVATDQGNLLVLDPRSTKASKLRATVTNVSQLAFRGG